MPVKSWKRDQVLGTRAWLIETALGLFGRQGYARTPLEQVVAEAGLTRGAVYHHFKDKRALFEAVVDRRLLDVVNDVERRTLKRAMTRGHERELDAIELFVDALRDATTRRLISLDGPAVLGRGRWSALMLERLLSPVRRAVDAAVERGVVAPELANGATQLVFGAVQEAALASGRGLPKEELDRALRWLLEGLLSPAS